MSNRPTKVQVNQIWRECDNRFVRDVLIIYIGDEKVMIQTVGGAHTSQTKSSRFQNVDGVAGGFRLIRWEEVNE